MMRLIALQHLVIFVARAQSTDNSTINQTRLIFSEKASSTWYKDAILGVFLASVPPFTNDIRQQDTEQEAVNKQDIFTIALSDDELRQGDTDAEALLSIGVAVLKVIVPDFFVGQCFICFGQFNEVVIESIDSFVLCGVGSNFVGMEFERQPFIMSANSFLVGTLKIDSN